jgi:hypothetical protein
VGLYKKWCDATKEEDKRKRYWTYVEKDGGRDEIRDELADTMRLHLHPLNGDRRGTWSVRVSGNWRVTFVFVGSDVDQVDYEDYH